MSLIEPIKSSFNEVEAKFYICKITTENSSHLGLIAGINNNFIKENLSFHEEAFHQKIVNCANSFRETKLQLSPVLLVYNDNDEIDNYIDFIVKNNLPNQKILRKNIYEFWEINDLNKIQNLYKKIKHFLVADGHHRIHAFSNFLQFNLLSALIVSRRNLVSKEICRKYLGLDFLLQRGILESLHKNFELKEIKKILHPLDYLVISADKKYSINSEFRFKILDFLKNNYNNVNFTHGLIEDYKENCREFKILIPDFKLGDNLKFQTLHPPYSSWFEPKIPERVITFILEN